MQVKYGWTVNSYSFLASKQYCTFSCCSVEIVRLTYHMTFENKEIDHLPISFFVDFRFEKDDQQGDYSFATWAWDLDCTFSCCLVAIVLLTCQVTLTATESTFFSYSFLIFMSHLDNNRGLIGLSSFAVLECFVMLHLKAKRSVVLPYPFL